MTLLPERFLSKMCCNQHKFSLFLFQQKGSAYIAEPFYFYKMEIQHKSDAKGGMFFYQNGDKVLAEMTYVWAGDKKIIIDHTEVNESLKGQGVGNKLVAAAVDKARAEGLTILPLCPFANAVMKKDTSFHDVLAS